MTNEVRENCINICFLGHVDSGKSTTIGHLCYEMGAVDKRTIDKLEETAKELGKGSFGFAFYCDNNKAERVSGITIQTTMKVFFTASRMVNVIDCPGHRDYLKNMITGTAQADVAVFVVPCAPTEFEHAIDKKGTLQEHMTLAYTLGVPNAIVAINKFDLYDNPEEAQKRFDEISGNIANKMKRLFNMKTTPVIPISGFKGIGLSAKGAKFDWFKGWTPEGNPNMPPIRCLEEAIDYIPQPLRMTEAPLRVQIVQVLDVRGIGKVFTGRIECGRCKPNQKVLVSPAGIQTEIKTLEIHKTARKEVVAGENCGIVLKVSGPDIEKIKPGSVISEVDRNPCKKTYAAYATVVFVDKVKCVKKGYSPTMDLGVSHVSTMFAKICDTGIKKGNEYTITKENPEEISGEKQCARVILVPSKSIVMEPFDKCKALGRFSLRDMRKTIAIGVVHEALTREETEARVPELSKDTKKAAVAAAVGGKKK
jgi:elongation factor 1-alpha